VEKRIIAGVEVNKISLTDLLFNKTMLLSYLLLAIGFFGLYEVIGERYFLLSAGAHDAGMYPGSREVAEAMKEAVFGSGSEVNREQPWTLYIVNYMYMIYSGSAIIFFVALAEIFNIEVFKKTAAGFMTFGLAMVFGGLFTIAADLNVLHMQWMFLTPNLTAGMWLMLPLYTIYIPFVIFEIYLIISKKTEWAKKIAYGILFLSVIIDLVEYYIQAKLFDMNTARHLWTTYPMLTLYFIVSAFVAAIAIMTIYSFLTYRNRSNFEFDILIQYLRKSALYAISILAIYEVVAYLFIDREVGEVILFSAFKYYFYAYILFAVVLPFLLQFKKHSPNVWIVVGSIFAIIGTYIGRYVFVYGGNAHSVSNYFGTGFQKFGEYEKVKDFILYSPHSSEILVVIGSFGVVLAVYTIINRLLDVSKVRDH
jgi:hypothetical protein